jgi:crossover junction endodeoxyribonuclease RusA
MIKLELPWTPSVNSYWTMANGRIIVSSDGLKYRSHVVEKIRAMRLACKISQEPMKGRLGVYVEAHPPADGRRRDLNNLWKCLLDSLEHSTAFVDDEQIDDERIIRCEPCQDGKVVVTIWELARAAS